ncbi:hypothetical protein ES702_04325 [subsurface metagenome]
MRKIISLFFIIVSLGTGCTEGKEIIRQPAFAGTWYPGNRDELSKTIDSFLKNARDQQLKGDLIALIAPHAGYAFSGPIAAESFKQLTGKKFTTVILIGPSHRYPLRDVSIFDRGYFLTPLGKIKVSEEASRMVEENPLIKFNPDAHRNEHCLEIELPFLQRTLKQFEIIPLLTGEMSLDKCSKVAETIVKHFAIGNTLLVASSDMSHYPSYKDATYADKKMLEVIKTLDPDKIASTSKSILGENIPGLSCTLCGENAVLTTIIAARKLKANCVTILKYSNSGDSHPPGWSDKSSVVGYGAVAITRYPSVSPEAQKELLNLARKAIKNYLKNKEVLKVTDASAELSQKLGLFVTLRLGKDLRGCIGRVEYPAPLCEIIGHLSCSAAFDDPRFPPLTEEELEKIRISVTVCSPLRKISSPDEIIPSLHGVFVKKGKASGLYLPSVWDESGWSKKEFLRNLCRRKAKLPEDAWKEKDVDLYIFTGHSFSEKQF